VKSHFDAIIVTSDEPYGKMWHTQLIYAQFLAKQSKLLFIEPPKKWRLSNLFKWHVTKREVSENFTLVQYPNILPSVYNWFNETYLTRFVCVKLKKLGVKNILIWHFDSFRSLFSSKTFNSNFGVKRIYHVIDPFYYNPSDKWLSDNCNLLVLTSHRNNGFYSRNSHKLINIPQCFDIEMQQKYIAGKAKISARFKEPYFILLGTISDAIDFDWMLSAFRLKNRKLVIIGSILQLKEQNEKWKKLVSFDNVEYLGLLNPAEFYPILKKGCGGIINYNEMNRKGVRSPLKALNYLAAGLPVLTNIECEIPELNGNCIYFCCNQEEFDLSLSDVLNGNIKFDMVKGDKFFKKSSVKEAVETILKKLV